MLEPLDIHALGYFAFILSFLCQDFAVGGFVTLIFHAVWIKYLGHGSFSQVDVQFDWTMGIMVGSIFGYLLSIVGNYHPVLRLLREVRNKGFKHGLRRAVARIALKTFVFIVLLGAALIPMEWQASPFDHPYRGGLLTNALVAIVFALYWWMLKGEHMVFQDAYTTVGGQVIEWGNESTSFILWPALHATFVLAAGWMSKQWISTNDWVINHWNLYSMLIAMGFISIIMIIVAYFIRFNGKDVKHRSKKGSEEEGANLTNKEANPSGTPGSFNPLGEQ